ncbi:MAG TPA: SRPBCC family protein [Pseudonocardiaceae bacterium]|nr:SRPBCC family protein [Pseudonocardiaceae bacterium]
MLIENTFQVAADPDRVFDFLQDANNVVTCMPGAELVEDLGDDSYAGKVKIKVGPVTAAYSGVAIITRRDPTERVAVLRAEGKDTKGNGSAKAVATMRVTPIDTGSTVQLSTELSVSGKLAQFGRSVMADVSNKMVGEMANRVRAAIEAATTPEPAATPAPPADDTIKASGIIWTVLTGIIRRLTARLRGKPTT